MYITGVVIYVTVSVSVLSSIVLHTFLAFFKFFYTIITQLKLHSVLYNVKKYLAITL